jgi:hypothetical protein
VVGAQLSSPQPPFLHDIILVPFKVVTYKVTHCPKGPEAQRLGFEHPNPIFKHTQHMCVCMHMHAHTLSQTQAHTCTHTGSVLMCSCARVPSVPVTAQ